MIDVLNLALPYFGLIFLGYAAAKWRSIPDAGLAWMDFFVLYLALPALFYRILARTPFEQLNNIPFIVATTLATFAAFVVSFVIALIIRRGQVAESGMAGLAGSYGNIGYMGPGLALSTLGNEAAAPVALIFCFDTLLLFTLVPLFMSFAGTERRGLAASIVEILRRILLHPLIIATALGVVSAAAAFEPPVALERLLVFLQSAAAPCALFALGLTVALRPIQKVPWEVPFAIVVKLIVHPPFVIVLLSLLGSFSPSWTAAAVLMAALPPALSVFVFARQYDTWVEQASGAVLLGTLVSVVTLTTVMWLVKNDLVPQSLFR
jgi:malonate transporter and related proteins